MNLTEEEFYNLLNQAGHRLGDLANNNAGYKFELYKLIEIVQQECNEELNMIIESQKEIIKLSWENEPKWIDELREMSRMYLAIKKNENN